MNWQRFSGQEEGLDNAGQQFVDQTRNETANRTQQMMIQKQNIENQQQEAKNQLAELGALTLPAVGNQISSFLFGRSLDGVVSDVGKAGAKVAGDVAKEGWEKYISPKASSIWARITTTTKTPLSQARDLIESSAKKGRLLPQGMPIEEDPPGPFQTALGKLKNILTSTPTSENEVFGKYNGAGTEDDPFNSVNIDDEEFADDTGGASSKYVYRQQVGKPQFADTEDPNNPYGLSNSRAAAEIKDGKPTASETVDQNEEAPDQPKEVPYDPNIEQTTNLDDNHPIDYEIDQPEADPSLKDRVVGALKDAVLGDGEEDGANAAKDAGEAVAKGAEDALPVGDIVALGYGAYTFFKGLFDGEHEQPAVPKLPDPDVLASSYFDPESLNAS